MVFWCLSFLYYLVTHHLFWAKILWFSCTSTTKKSIGVTRIPFRCEDFFSCSAPFLLCFALRACYPPQCARTGSTAVQPVQTGGSNFSKSRKVASKIGADDLPLFHLPKINMLSLRALSIVAYFSLRLMNRLLVDKCVFWDPPATALFASWRGPSDQSSLVTL